MITNESELTYGIVMEGITTHDRSGIAPNGQRVLPNGGIISDRKAYLQANMTRDNTKSVNDESVGDRNVIQIEQGVGIGIFPVFNRHQLTRTKFMQLKFTVYVQVCQKPCILNLLQNWFLQNFHFSHHQPLKKLTYSLESSHQTILENTYLFSKLNIWFDQPQKI